MPLYLSKSERLIVVSHTHIHTTYVTNGVCCAKKSLLYSYVKILYVYLCNFNFIGFLPNNFFFRQTNDTLYAKDHAERIVISYPSISKRFLFHYLCSILIEKLVTEASTSH